MSSIIGAQLDAAFYEPLARRFCGCRIDAHVIFRGRRFTRETHHQPVSRRNPASRAERVALGKPRRCAKGGQTFFQLVVRKALQRFHGERELLALAGIGLDLVK